MRGFLRGVLCAAVLAGLLAAVCLSAGASGWLRGDADGDGEVTSFDVTAVQRVLAGIYPDADGSMARRGDVTGDTLTLLDATEIQRWLAHCGSDYPIGEPVGGSDETTAPVIVFPTEDNQLPIIRK